MLQLLNNIFRQNAIDSLNTIDGILEDLQIIETRSWVLILAAVLTLLSIVTWCFFGKVSLTVETQGIVITKAQLDEIENTNRKAILYQKDSVADLYDLYLKKVELFEKHYITRIELKQSKDEYEIAKEKLIDLEKNLQIYMIKSNSENNLSGLQILAFTDHRQAKKIKPGMHVRVSSSISTEFNNNHITGKVISISLFPVTKPLAYSYLRNSSLVDAYFQFGTPFMIKIELPLDDKKIDLQPGEAIYGKIKYKTLTPLQLLSKK